MKLSIIIPTLKIDDRLERLVMSIPQELRERVIIV